MWGVRESAGEDRFARMGHPVNRERYEKHVHSAQKEAHHLKRSGGLMRHLEKLHIELRKGKNAD